MVHRKFEAFSFVKNLFGCNQVCVEIAFLSSSSSSFLSSSSLSSPSSCVCQVQFNAYLSLFKFRTRVSVLLDILFPLVFPTFSLQLALGNHKPQEISLNSPALLPHADVQCLILSIRFKRLSQPLIGPWLVHSTVSVTSPAIFSKCGGLLPWTKPKPEVSFVFISVLYLVLMSSSSLICLCLTGRSLLGVLLFLQSFCEPLVKISERNHLNVESAFKSITLESLCSRASPHFAIQRVTGILICFLFPQVSSSSLHFTQGKSSWDLIWGKSFSSIIKCVQYLLCSKIQIPSHHCIRDYSPFRQWR